MEKKSIEELRAELLQVEAEIKKIVGKEPGQFYIKFPSEEDVERIDELIGDRKYILDRMFSYTPEEMTIRFLTFYASTDTRLMQSWSANGEQTRKEGDMKKRWLVKASV